MKTLTAKEEEIMHHYWTYGDMQIRELQSHYDDPKPHVNTLSTLVKIFLLVNPVISENLVNLEKQTSVLSGVKSFS